MFSTLLRQQARLVSSARLNVPLTRHFLPGLPQFVQKPHILSQRAFSISRSLSEEDYSRQSSRRDFSRQKRSRRPAPGPVVEKRTLYVSNMPYNVTEAELRELLEPYGEIKEIRLSSDSQGRPAGFGFVEFAQLEDAVAAHRSCFKEPFVLSDRSLRIGYAHRTTLQSSPQELPPSTTIHISNFPFPGEETPLRQLFQDYDGHILRINFMKDFNGNHTGKTFIQFTDQQTADAAMKAFQDYNLDGTVLKTSYARNRIPPRTSQMADFDA